ncbi:Hypothetical protein LUCI_2396 [Lucifera butyrica]|uniref:Uncharacterized protein n=1 Tax=Lucifera butyrica TaxID=1351585 RepID=A0A498RA43_9FIRM|nr:hypothetical protein [Lucifera butyrica]VBB07152.1 Hypothetical protein LUCI_2396 [Lucifera butyrica]
MAMINIRLLIEWLDTMAKDMEKHRGDLYSVGAAKSYRLVLQILESGLFDIKDSVDSEAPPEESDSKKE